MLTDVVALVRGRVPQLALYASLGRHHPENGVENVRIRIVERPGREGTPCPTRGAGRTLGSDLAESQGSRSVSSREDDNGACLLRRSDFG